MENINEVARLVGEIQMLAVLVNERTDYAVFTRFSGHVKTWSLDIRKSKQDYHTHITSDEMYVKDGVSTISLKKMKLNLRKILRDNKITYNELNYSIREEYDYHLV